MAPKPAMSITLPRDFQFHYSDNDLPKTPVPMADEELMLPPQPPRQTFKVRRRRPADNVARDLASDDSQPLPTFEMTEAHGQDEGPFSHYGAALTPGYLAPRSSILPLLSPPKTPVSQTHTYDAEKEENEWSMVHNSQYIARPVSACSSVSCSSTSSFGSDNSSRGDYGGSCTSPESDAADPFSYTVSKDNNPIFSPDLTWTPSEDSPMVKRSKTNRHSKWTPEMDDHLWLTYMFYVQDPRVTPFKTLPGTAPPLGVCHRVAREAKNSWPRYRAATLLEESQHPRISIERKESPDTIRADGAERDGSSTPIAPDQYKIPSKWIRSEGATRKRLRELCKRKPSLSIHYQRLLKTRSPSPFQSSSSPQSRSDPQSTAMSSASLQNSLSAAAPSSLHTDAPIAPTPSVAPAAPKAEVKPERPDGWYQRIGRSQAHQKSRSLQLGLGLGHGFGSSPNPQGALASPFDGDSDRQNLFSGTSQSLGRAFHRRTESGKVVLNSPLELHAPVPTSRSLKRRFRLDDDSTSNAYPSQNTLESLFANSGSLDTPARPVRERAFSLGSVQDGTRSLNSFFHRPTVLADIPMSDANEPPSSEERPSNSFLQLPNEPAPRLGSPFGGASAAAAPHFNTFPRRFTPLGSEMPPSNFAPNQSLEATFRQLAARRD